MSIGFRRQAGATLVISLIMLVMLTLMVLAAHTLSVTNLKTVANMQFRNEAIAAANLAIEQVASTNFAVSPPATQNVTVDVNQDGAPDYTVIVPTPQCLSTQLAILDPNNPADVPFMSGTSTGIIWYDSRWQIEGAVNDATTGAVVTVRQGVNRRIVGTTCP